MEITAEGRAHAKEQDKVTKNAAAVAAAAQKQQDKAEAAATRSAIKDVGDAIKGSVRIAKVGGMWTVLPGSLSFPDISFHTFNVLIARGPAGPHMLGHTC